MPQSASPTKTLDAVSWSGLNLEGGQFADVVRLAAQICGAPVALVSVIEAGQQIPKASIGITASTAPLNEVICQHTINERDLLVIPDLSADLRTACHPLVTADPALRFYAGVFLVGSDDKPLGTLCIMDREPRPGGLTDNQAGALAALGRQVVTLLNLQRERSRFEAVFNSAVDYAIIVMNRDGRITDWNEGARQILGWTPEEICGRDLDAFFTPEDRRQVSLTRRWKEPEPSAAGSMSVGTFARAASASGPVAR